MKKYNLLILLSVVLIGLISCEEESVTPVADDDSEVYKGTVFNYLTSVPAGLEWGDVSSHFIIQKYGAINSSTSLHYFTERSDAWTSDDSHNSVDAGDVELDNVLLEKHMVTDDGDDLYTYNIYSPIQLAHTYNWDIEGSASFPAFTKSILSPSTDMSITSHSDGGSISNGSDLTITWGGTYETENQVKILLAGAGYSYVALVSDNGSYTIPAADMSNYSIGITKLIVTRGRYSFEQLPSSSKYAFFAVVLTEAIKVNMTN
jgi:hypothetical protein